MFIIIASLFLLNLIFVTSKTTNIDDLVCSPYSTYNESLKVCICPDEIKRFLHCNESGYIDAVKDCACVTYNEDTDEIEVGYCIYGCGRPLHRSYINRASGFSFIGTDKFKWNAKSCGPYLRTGTLCGSCLNDTYPPAFSFDTKCIQCLDATRDIRKYILWEFLPLTVFYFAMLLLQINVLSSELFGFVFYSQLMSFPPFIRSQVINKTDRQYVATIVRSYEFVYEIWNLDFFRTFSHGFCLSSNILTILSLDFIVAIYPLFLMAITYLAILLYDKKYRLLTALLSPVIKFFLRFNHNWDIRTSTVDSFATFFLLSNVKLLSTCLDLLIPVNVYRFKLLPNVTAQSKKLYSDATVDYFGPEHSQYALAAILVFVIFVFIPVLILLLYPFKFFQRLMIKFPSRFILFLKIFVDSFQGCYKDGTEPGSRDYRWVSALPFGLRWLSFSCYGSVLNASFFPFVTMATVLTVIFLIVVEPLQKNYQSMSYSWIIHALLLVLFCVCATGTDIVQITGQSILILHTFYTIYIIVTFLPILAVLLLMIRYLLGSKPTLMLYNTLKLRILNSS